MRFEELQISGSFGIIIDKHQDERGEVKNLFGAEFLNLGFHVKQTIFVTNPAEGTLRGLHYQSNEYAENKIVLPIFGKLSDRIIDLRINSSSYLNQISLEIGTGCRFQGILVPAGCAHGYLTLVSNTNIVYFMDNSYSIDNSCGIRWDDPNFGFSWPTTPFTISEKDRNWPNFPAKFDQF